MDCSILPLQYKTELAVTLLLLLLLLRMMIMNEAAQWTMRALASLFIAL